MSDEKTKREIPAGYIKAEYGEFISDDWLYSIRTPDGVLWQKATYRIDEQYLLEEDQVCYIRPENSSPGKARAIPTADEIAQGHIATVTGKMINEITIDNEGKIRRSTIPENAETWDDGRYVILKEE